jgi:hypothetical protein
MRTSLPSLDAFYPPWRDISYKYEMLFQCLKTRIKDPSHYKKMEESLFWEYYAFEIILTILLYKGIQFETSVEDIQPIVQDMKGTSKEIDFRIHIGEIPVLFGVTHFQGRPKDLRKDVERTNIPLLKFRRDGFPLERNGTLVSTRPQREYLNRRIAVRIAREGKIKFYHDYIYILFPKLDIGFGGGLDVIPIGFQFDKYSKYKYMPVAITGLILIGQYIETEPPHTGISENELIVRTKVFQSCSPKIARILRFIDNTIIDETKRNKQVKEILSKKNKND